MALVPNRLADEVVELSRCGFDDLVLAVQAIHESWTELHHWLLWAQEEVTLTTYGSAMDEHIKFFDDNQDWRYFIVDQRDATLVGMANLYRLSSPDRVGIGYWVRTSRTRRGYASRATRLLVATAFAYLPMVNIVEIQMDATNLASMRVPEKLGFRRVAAIRRDMRVPGHSGLSLLWELDRATWNSLVRVADSIIDD
jgi:RimJ/RimL family protein N-acetyltransferase